MNIVVRTVMIQGHCYKDFSQVLFRTWEMSLPYTMFKTGALNIRHRVVLHHS